MGPDEIEGLRPEGVVVPAFDEHVAHDENVVRCGFHEVGPTHACFRDELSDPR
jgi:hypothetical protein